MALERLSKRPIKKYIATLISALAAQNFLQVSGPVKVQHYLSHQNYISNRTTFVPFISNSS